MTPVSSPSEGLALEGGACSWPAAPPRDPRASVSHERVELAERVDGAGSPPVEIVSMAGAAGPLHERTRQELDAVRRRGEKAIVLLNRRGLVELPLLPAVRPRVGVPEL